MNNIPTFLNINDELILKFDEIKSIQPYGDNGICVNNIQVLSDLSRDESTKAVSLIYNCITAKKPRDAKITIDNGKAVANIYILGVGVG